jgi:lipopolysaccharide/colanic/teichoic acid biosynthesis glycosyltransferase
MGYTQLKRVLDFAASFLLMSALAPALAFLAFSVLVVQGRPVFFRQTRIGKSGVPFTVLKFRTMNVQKGGKIDNGEGFELSPLGDFLRRTSFDELPQLVNIFLGHMSFVGPRPLLPDYMKHYNTEQARRHEVRPGLTGLAQVSGRNHQTWNERFQLDVTYVDNQSLTRDAFIIIKTLKVVISGRGVKATTSTVMPKFRGMD